jgi:hypothetical protein
MQRGIIRVQEESKVANQDKKTQQSKTSKDEWMDMLREDNPDLSDEELEELAETT